MIEIIATAIGLVATFLFIGVFWFMIPIRMARKRGRSTTGWVVLFWLISPLWGIIALKVLGDSEHKIREDIVNELRREQTTQPQSQE